MVIADQRKNWQEPHFRCSINGRENGTTVVEMALVFPIFLFLLFAISTLAWALTVRYVLEASAAEAAKVCALKRDTTKKCVDSVVKSAMGSFLNSCDDEDIVKLDQQLPAQQGIDPPYTRADTFTVTLECKFNKGLGLAYVQKQKDNDTGKGMMEDPTIKAYATYTY